MKILHFIRIPLFALLMANCFFLLISTKAKAQSTSALIASDTSSAIEEKLVQLAWQSPELQNTAHQTKIDEYQLKAAQNVWMNLLAFNVNYNEFTFQKTPLPTTYVYPRYNLGITVPLGTLLSRTAAKSARENIEIGKNNTELLKRDIRERVLTAYKEYMAYAQLIAIQSELTNDAKIQLAQSEEKFRNGTTSIETYNSAQKNNNAELAALINLKLQQDLKKLELEKLIGVKLETVLKK